MPYSTEIEKYLKQRRIGLGDRIRLTKKDRSYEGVLMPASVGDEGYLVIKLNNGYNIGIDFRGIETVERLKSGKASHAEPAKAVDAETAKKPQLSLIATGGTIGSRVDYQSGGVSALMSPAELVAMAPEIAEFAYISSIQSPFLKLSEDLEIKDWVKLARLCVEELKKPAVKGVLLTHGTDTLHFTSAALSFLIKDLNKPVVLVGAQRSSDRGSSDAAMNLICAARIAISDIAEVGICMHAGSGDEYCIFNRGTKVRKMHTSRRDAFRPINALPITEVFPDGRIKWLSEHRKRDEGKTPTLHAKVEEGVVLIKFHPGLDPGILDYYVRKGYKGIIIESTGLGHVHSKWIPFIERVVKKGMLVFFTPQTIYGRLNLDVYSNGRNLLKAGVTPLEDMLSETALVKLAVVLGMTSKPERVKELMLTNMAGEISERHTPEEFLA